MEKREAKAVVILPVVPATVCCKLTCKYVRVDDTVSICAATHAAIVQFHLVCLSLVAKQLHKDVGIRAGIADATRVHLELIRCLGNVLVKLLVWPQLPFQAAIALIGGEPCT